MKDQEIYFWEPSISPHKTELIGRLKEHPDVRAVYYIAEQNLDEDRRKQGWLHTSGFRIEDAVIAPSKDEISRIVKNSSADSVHIFSGLRRVPCIVHGLREVIRHKRRFGIMSEPRDADGWKGLLRLGQSWLTEGGLRKNSTVILAIGRHGPGWFRRAGYAKKKIFPFAYFSRSSSEYAADPGRSLSREGRVIGYVGRMTEDKGFRLFIESLRHLKSAAKVIIAGVGSDAEYVRHITNPNLEIDCRGVVAMDKIPALMQEMDVLVVPSLSKNDGWAMVISEALLAGTAVIASLQVGGSICLEREGNGQLLQNLCAKDLAEKIDLTLSSGLISGSQRQSRKEWAGKRLTAQAGADYLMSILSHVYGSAPRPEPFYN